MFVKENEGIEKNNSNAYYGFNRSDSATKNIKFIPTLLVKK